MADIKIFEADSTSDMEKQINDWQTTNKMCIKACPIVPLVVPTGDGEGSTKIKHFAYAWIKESIVSQAQTAIKEDEKVIEAGSKESSSKAPEPKKEPQTESKTILDEIDLRLWNKQTFSGNDVYYGKVEGKECMIAQDTKTGQWKIKEKNPEGSQYKWGFGTVCGTPVDNKVKIKTE